MVHPLTAEAAKNAKDILTLSIKHQGSEKALVIYDTQCGLAQILTEAYRIALPKAEFVDFDSLSKEEILEKINALVPRDLVVLIQSSNFRLNEFRIRLHLFNRKLKVIEHVHLARNSETVWDVYVKALEYDPAWYLNVGPKLMKRLEKSEKLVIRAGEAELIVEGALEAPKPNLGDYSAMENIGGTFPIGEVFTESKEFAAMNGSFMIYAFAGNDFLVNMHEPFRIDIEKGIVAGWGENTPQSFRDIVNMVKGYERPIIREVGFGLNRAITRERYLEDITAFERIHGMHLSLGEKHSVFKKSDVSTGKAKFHVDLFPLVENVQVNGETIFENGTYTV